MQQPKADLPQAIIYPPNKGRRKRTNLKLLRPAVYQKTLRLLQFIQKKKQSPQVAALNEWKRLKHLQNHEI